MTEEGAQLAVIAAQQRADHDRLGDHETRLRLVEAAVLSLATLPELVKDLEQRQRADEQFRYALPLSLVAALFSAAAAVLSALGTFVFKGG